MANSFSSKGNRLYQPRFVAKWLGRSMPHPDTFVCGVRVVHGEVAGQTKRWRYRSSAVDRLISDGVVTLNHGVRNVLGVRMEDGWVPHPDRSVPRVGFVVLRAVAVDSGAIVEIAASLDEIERFGITDA